MFKSLGKGRRSSKVRAREQEFNEDFIFFKEHPHLGQPTPNVDKYERAFILCRIFGLRFNRVKRRRIAGQVLENRLPQ